MISKLTDSKQLKSPDDKILFNYKLYIKAIEAISNDIINNPDLNSDRVGLVGLARGALPMLTSVSHFTGKRIISTIQNKMTNSDNCFDYGDISNLSINLHSDFDKFILLEDIVYKGKTITKSVDLIQQSGKEVLAIYTLIIDENFPKYNKLDLPIKYCYNLKADQWVYFLWETNINERK